ncbi:MAG: YciI family protein [Chloroflexi bacterium]|nr:YciI family protein [Chloroflexota bacterium]
MNYYALLYTTVADYVNLRAPFRATHLALAEAAQQRGELLLGGAFSDPADGALLVFRAESAAVVEQFVAADPYVQNGLVTQWEIRPWTVVIGRLFESRP